MTSKPVRIALPLVLALLALLTGCATPQRPTDYTAFRAAKPTSILVLPPVNKTPELLAGPAMMARATLPLAESGYYVLPVTLVSETMHQNGITVPEEMHAVPLPKLREIFGADAVMFITVQDYGQRYYVVGSANTVRAEAVLADLRSGQQLWRGSAVASDQGNSQGGLAGMLIGAVVRQVVGSLSDQGFKVAAVASQNLLMAGRPEGLLFGPRRAGATPETTR